MYSQALENQRDVAVIKQITKGLAALVLIFCGLGSAWAAVDPPQGDQVYRFPIADKFKATVVGTPEAFQAKFPEIPIKRDRLTIFPDRKVPEYLWYESEMRYSYAFQDKPAPLVFMIAGTGGSYSGAKNVAMGRAYYHSGFHVVSISSPTQPNFIVSASKTGVAGHAFHDAEDLFNVMAVIWTQFKSELEVTDW